jgi:hypothetical protein
MMTNGNTLKTIDTDTLSAATGGYFVAYLGGPMYPGFGFPMRAPFGPWPMAFGFRPMMRVW